MLRAHEATRESGHRGSLSVCLSQSGLSVLRQAACRGGKLWVDQWMGKEKNIRLLRCGYCRTTFSERQGTALEEARLPAAEVEKIVMHLQEGCGIRRTARLTGHARSTVGRYAVVAGAHARAVHDETMRGLTCTEIQADEKWAFVRKKRS